MVRFSSFSHIILVIGKLIKPQRIANTTFIVGVYIVANVVLM